MFPHLPLLLGEALSRRWCFHLILTILTPRLKNIDDFTAGNKFEASSSSLWQPGLSSLNSSPCQSPTSVAKLGFHSPKLSRLHQQVTQFKLLKLAQNQGTQCKHSFLHYLYTDIFINNILCYQRLWLTIFLCDCVKKEKTFCSLAEIMNQYKCHYWLSSR